jgi:LacI family transcriptional regulator
MRPDKNSSSARPVSKAVSIEDVASEANVSTATVSRVLNNPTLVAPATALRVQEAIAKLDYHPNAIARGLSTRKSHVLGLALPDIFGEFYSDLLRGADAEARRLGYYLLVGSEAGIRERSVHEGALGVGLVDGLAVMITEPDTKLLPELKKMGLPLVVMDAESAGDRVDTITVDNAVGSREAATHLLAATPAERCWFVGGPRENFDTLERARAFSETLASRGHAVRADQVAYGTYSMEWGRQWAERMLKDKRGLKGAAVLAGNDEIAYGVMTAAVDAGLRVPGDVRIVGFDDTRLASIVRPRLSTVRMPAGEIGAGAVRALVERVKNPDSPATHVKLPSALVVRESSAG